MSNSAKSPLKLGLVIGAALLMGVAACDTDSILEVTDPDLVLPENVQGEKGAELFWSGALGQFALAFSSGGGGQAMYVGMFTDEFVLSGTFPTRNQVDRREILIENGTMLGQYRQLHQARTATNNATEVMEEFLPGDSRIAELYSLEGYTYIFFAENYCSGVPYGETPREGEPIDGIQTTTEETWSLALQHFQSASAATGGDTDQENLARMGRARVLMNQGQYAAAAAEVTGIPTSWAYLVRSKGGGAFNQRNAIFELNQSQRRWSMWDSEGGNGIAYRDGDPRLPFEEGTVGFDEETPLWLAMKFDSWDSDTELASGVEARLIEAEAALDAGTPAAAFAFLNDLRGDVGLADLVDPGTDPERVDILFEERARWLYASGHRLGDMRRLIRQYGRDSETVFPTGIYFKGGNYGPDVNFPIPFEETQNSNVSATPICLDRNP